MLSFNIERGEYMIIFRLNRIMERKNLTIQDVHELTGISRNTISQMVNKEPKGIQFETLDKLLTKLDVSVNELIDYVPAYELKTFEITELEDPNKTSSPILSKYEGTEIIPSLKKGHFVSQLIESFLFRIRINEDTNSLGVVLTLRVLAKGSVEVNEAQKSVELHTIEIGAFDDKFKALAGSLINEDLYAEIRNKIGDIISEDLMLSKYIDTARDPLSIKYINL